MQKIYTGFCGIDIGKNSFVAHLKGSEWTYEYENNLTGFQKFFSLHKDALVNSLTILETTGGYERDCLDFLLENDIAVHRADARKVKNFVRSYGQNAKTDALDAKALSSYGYERSDRLPIYQKPSKRQRDLQLLVERRQDLTQMLVQEKNRYQAPLNKSLRSTIKPIIKCLEKQLVNVES